MTPSFHRPVNLARWGAGLLAILAVASGVLALARNLPTTPWGVAVGFVAGLPLLPFLASPAEWFVHRYVYHRSQIPTLRTIYDIHHRVHHYVFFPSRRYVTTGPPRRIPILTASHDDAATTSVGNAAIHLAHWTFYMLLAAVLIWLPCWLFTGSLPLLAGLVASSVVVSDLMVIVHDSIHRPGIHPFLERQGWFRFLDRHHYIHHVDTEANANFLLPLSDRLFGTLRTALTEEEIARHGTWEQAKVRPVGAGETAHRALRAGPPCARFPWARGPGTPESAL